MPLAEVFRVKKYQAYLDQFRGLKTEGSQNKPAFNVSYIRAYDKNQNKKENWQGIKAEYEPSITENALPVEFSEKKNKDDAERYEHCLLVERLIGNTRQDKQAREQNHRKRQENIFGRRDGNCS